MQNKNIFFKSTLILIIGGIITKILGFIIRIIYARVVGSEVLGLYSLVTPTYSLLVTIAYFSLPITISKLVAEGKHNNTRVISTSFFVIMTINFVVVAILLLSARFIATTLLHEEKCYLIIVAMTLTYPIVSISAIIKGYFYGKQNMIPNAVSNIIEEVVRLTLVCVFVPKLMEISDILAASSLFIFTFIEEVVSILVNLFFLPKHIKIKKVNLIPDKYTYKSIMSVSLPSVSSRIIGNIGYFFEPIILTNLLLYTGFSSNYIVTEYGAYNAYAITILTVPSFFITAISSSLVPEISKHYLNRNGTILKKRLKEAIIFSLIIGISYSGALMFLGKYLLNLMYDTNLGLNYIKILAPIFPLFYIESILMSFLQAINKAKISMKITIMGILVKTISMSILAICSFGMYSLVISEIINIFVVVYLDIYYVKKYLKYF